VDYSTWLLMRSFLSPFSERISLGISGTILWVRCLFYNQFNETYIVKYVTKLFAVVVVAVDMR